MRGTAVAFYIADVKTSPIDWLQEHGQEEDEEEHEVEGTKEQDPDTEEEGSKKIISSRRIRSSFLSQVDEILSHCAAGKDGDVFLTR